MRILQANPLAAYLAYRNEIDEAIRRVLAGGWYILGKETEAFEAEFAAFLGVRHGIGVANGTEALELALRACGIAFGDEVITASHTAVATVAAIELAGAVPVLVDIDPATYTMNPALLEAVLTPRTRALVPVHLYGQPADLPGILEFARHHDLRVIEDCAQAHGATLTEVPQTRASGTSYRPAKKVGTFGDIAAFSFYPTKNLGAIGDGGMVVTNDPVLAEQVRSLREYGWKERHVSRTSGMNSRLDELQAAILRVKLRYLEKDNERRIALARQYNELLRGTGLRVPIERPGTTHVFHLYVVAHQRRDELQHFLGHRDIGTGIHYPVPVHLQPAYKDRLHILSPLVETERAARQVLSLPLYPELNSTEVVQVAEAIRAWAS